MSEELKPCPFCGENDAIMTITFDGLAAGAVVCKRCFFDMMTPNGKPPTVSVWNTRPVEDTLRAEIARLREQTIDYENDIFLGQPIEYWMRVKAQLDADNSDNYIREILLLKHKLARRDEYISKLEAKIPKLNIDLAEASTHAYNGESARMKLEAELARLQAELKVTQERCDRYEENMARHGLVPVAGAPESEG